MLIWLLLLRIIWNIYQSHNKRRIMCFLGSCLIRFTQKQRRTDREGAIGSEGDTPLSPQEGGNAFNQ